MKKHKLFIYFILIYFTTSAQAGLFHNYIHSAANGQLYCPNELTQSQIAYIKKEFLYAEPFPVLQCKYQLTAIKKNRLHTAFQKELMRAEQGSSQAAYKVAVAYATGIGVKKSNKKYINWILLSTKKGNIEATKEAFTIYMNQKQNLTKDQCTYINKSKLTLLKSIYHANIGAYYFIKSNLAMNSNQYHSALQYIKKAAKLKYSQSDLTLGSYYLMGERQDTTLAKKYLLLSLKARTDSIYSRISAYELLINIEQINEPQKTGLIHQYVNKMVFFQKLAGFTHSETHTKKEPLLGDYKLFEHE